MPYKVFIRLKKTNSSIKCGTCLKIFQDCSNLCHRLLLLHVRPYEKGTFQTFAIAFNIFPPFRLQILLAGYIEMIFKGDRFLSLPLAGTLLSSNGNTFQSGQSNMQENDKTKKKTCNMKTNETNKASKMLTITNINILKVIF